MSALALHLVEQHLYGSIWDTFEAIFECGTVKIFKAPSLGDARSRAMLYGLGAPALVDERLRIGEPHES